MNEIICRTVLNKNVILLEISAPAIAQKAEPGQFVILITD